MTKEQKARIAKLAQKECGFVLQDAEECDGFKHRDRESFVDIVGDDDDKLDAADDYLFKCIGEIRKALAKGTVQL